MSALVKTYAVSGSDFSRAGEASAAIKRILKSLGFTPETIRRVSIASYEAEINMVIHGGGGTVTATVSPEEITVVFEDRGPGIPDIGLAMQEGWSTATNKIRELGFGAGMGLPNIKKYADTIDIRSQVGEGTTVVIRILAENP